MKGTGSDGLDGLGLGDRVERGESCDKNRWQDSKGMLTVFRVAH